MTWNAEACRSGVVTHISPKRFSGLTVRLYRTLIGSRALSQLHPDRIGIILPVPTRVGMAPECLCMPGLLPYRCSARGCLRPRGLVSHSPLTCTDAWLAHRSTCSAVTQTFPFSGLCVRCRASTLHLAEPPLPKTVVPGGWIDLTREGFCYA